MQTSGMPWPGDEGQQRWEQAWMAIKKVRSTILQEKSYDNYNLQLTNIS